MSLERYRQDLSNSSLLILSSEPKDIAVWNPQTFWPISNNHIFWLDKNQKTSELPFGRSFQDLSKDNLYFSQFNLKQKIVLLNSDYTWQGDLIA